MERLREVLAPVGVFLGATMVVLGYILMARDVMALGIPVLWWQAIGAFIFFGSVIAILFEGIQRPLSKVLAARASSTPVSLQEARIELLPTMISQERILANVTPEYLTSLFDDHTSIQAQKLTEAYIGKWMKLSGPLGDIRSSREDFAAVSFKDRPLEVFMHFRGKKWIDRLAILRRDTQITVLGQITNVASSYVDLDNCELVDSPSDEHGVSQKIRRASST